MIVMKKICIILASLFLVACIPERKENSDERTYIYVCDQHKEILLKFVDDNAEIEFEGKTYVLSHQRSASGMIYGNQSENISFIGKGMTGEFEMKGVALKNCQVKE